MKPDHPLNTLSALTVDVADTFDRLNPEEVDDGADDLPHAGGSQGAGPSCGSCRAIVFGS
jgi:hypothetical protein